MVVLLRGSLSHSLGRDGKNLAMEVSGLQWVRNLWVSERFSVLLPTVRSGVKTGFVILNIS